MATGISQHEKLSKNAQVVALVDEALFKLPGNEVNVRIEYPGKVPEQSILKPLAADFYSLLKGSRQKIKSANTDSLMLTDNFQGLHFLLSSKVKPTLVYLDPPYGTGMDFQSRQLQHAYADDMGTAAYLEFMRRRLILIRELLSDDGSVYVHIGHQMVAHLKVLMDEIFGSKNFRNLITRKKCSSKNFTRNQYSNLNDYILFYSKSSNYKWNQPGMKPDQEWIEKEYPKKDAKGLYKLVPVHAPGTRRGETGKVWRGMLPPPGKHWQFAPNKLDAFDAAGEIHWSKNGNPRRKVYLPKDKMINMSDYWDKFRDAHHQSIEITGYPTEKNLDMLKLIVGASSDPGDIVLDPFCGSGTTLHAARDLGRKWIGMDQSFVAVKTAYDRLMRGLRPMGDYVNKESSVQKSFSFENPTEDNFSVITSGEVLRDHSDELDELLFNL